MSAAVQDPGWEAFRASIAQLADLPPARIQPDVRIVEDLQFDSIQLAQTVVMLIDDYGLDSHQRGMEARAWQGVTVGALYEEARCGDASRD
jgi:hypothetical protein